MNPFLKARQSFSRWHSSIKQSTARGNLLALLAFANYILLQTYCTTGGSLLLTCKLIAYAKYECSN